MQRLLKHVASSVSPPLYGDQKLRIISYNVLADKYKGYHPYCPHEYLAWTYRWPKIAAELQYYKPDLLFLQEVEQTVYDNQLQPWMQQQGYSSLYQPRPTPAGQQGSDEGVSLHFATNTLDIVATQQLRFADSSWVQGLAAIVHSSGSLNSNGSNSKQQQACSRHSDEHRFLDKLLQRPEGCVMALLQHKPSDQLLLVCSTHLFWDPVFPDVKVAQAAAMCSSIAQLIQQQGRRLGEVAVVVAGDFNSLPEKYVSDKWDQVAPGQVLQSGVYQLMQQGHLSPGHPDHPANRTCSSGNSTCLPVIQQQQQQQQQHLAQPAAADSPALQAATISKQHSNQPTAAVAEARFQPEVSVPVASAGSCASSSARRDGSVAQQDGNSSQGLTTCRFDTAGLQLSSSYHMAHGREPVLTTRTATFSGCLDYIWLSTQHFQVTHTLEMPYPEPAHRGPPDQLVSSEQFAPCPNKVFPSDHLAVGCEVVLLSGGQLQ